MVDSLSVDISNAPPCELKTAVDSIYLNYTDNLCKYNNIKVEDIANEMSNWSTALVYWNIFILFISPSIYRCISRKDPRYLLLFYFIVSIELKYST